MRLGFACHWNESRETTWSGTPAGLRAALIDLCEVVDVGTQLNGILRTGLRALGTRRVDGKWKSLWRHGTLTTQRVERQLRYGVQSADPDVVLEIQDLAVLDRPYMVVQDLSYNLLLENFSAGGVPHFHGLSRRQIDRLRARQDRIYQSAAALLPMSGWLAASLVAQGVSSDRIHVINPGVNATWDRPDPPRRRQSSVFRLLFIGRDFETKGGPQVVAAFARLREEFGPRVRLTIAGPPRWPLRGPIPIGVDYLGVQSRSQVGQLLDSHDLFVMPSLMEGFGMAFAEALSRGLPCIGRDACAMPEIIDATTGGRLVRNESAESLAELIIDVWHDDMLYQACAKSAARRREHYSWVRAAKQVVDVAGTLV